METIHCKNKQSYTGTVEWVCDILLYPSPQKHNFSSSHGSQYWIGVKSETGAQIFYQQMEFHKNISHTGIIVGTNPMGVQKQLPKLMVRDLKPAWLSCWWFCSFIDPAWYFWELGKKKSPGTQETKGRIRIISLYHRFLIFQSQYICKKNASYCFNECY